MSEAVQGLEHFASVKLFRWHFKYQISFARPWRLAANAPTAAGRDTPNTQEESNMCLELQDSS